MTPSFLRFRDVKFAYHTSAEVLFEDLTLHLDSGWTGVVGPNGSGKTTLLKLATGFLEPTAGAMDRPPRGVYCPQRTDEPPENFRDFLSSTDRNANIIKGQLGILEGWNSRWHTLSHGERKRAQIGVALWLDPDVLAIDEPTNHVDEQARALLAAGLHSFSAVGLLVSHDRDLLDSLCGQCVFIDPPTLTLRKGGYTKGRQVVTEEKKALQKQREKIQMSAVPGKADDVAGLALSLTVSF